MFTSLVKKVFATQADRRITQPTPPAALKLEALGDRIVPSSVDFRPQTQNDSSSPHTAFINGDNGANTFVVRYDGDGGITITDEDGSFHSHSNVSRIQITGDSGNDVVRFALDSTLRRDLEVNVSLNGGNDRFTGTVAGNMLYDIDLTVNVSGGAGNDLLTMYATETAPARANDHLTDGLTINPGGMYIRSGATFDLTMTGDGDYDRIYADYEGQMDGVLQLNLRGGEKQDTVSAIVRLLDGSTGQVGTDTRAAVVAGDSDNDNLTFFIYNPDGTHLTHRAVIDGGWDWAYWANNDVGHRTDNVTAVEVEADYH
jgi:hypothetical protein